MARRPTLVCCNILARCGWRILTCLADVRFEPHNGLKSDMALSPEECQERKSMSARSSSTSISVFSKRPARFSSSSSRNMAPILIRSHFSAFVFGLTGESKCNLINVLAKTMATQRYDQCRSGMHSARINQADHAGLRSTNSSPNSARAVAARWAELFEKPFHEDRRASPTAARHETLLSIDKSTAPFPSHRPWS